MHQLPETGYLRLPQIIGDPNANPPIPAVIPVSKSTWWNGVKSGRYPSPVRTLGLRITCWKVEAIRALIEANRPDETALLANAENTEAYLLRKKEYPHPLRAERKPINSLFNQLQL